MKKIKVLESLTRRQKPVLFIIMILCEALLLPSIFPGFVPETETFLTKSPQLFEQKENEIKEKLGQIKGYFTENRGQIEDERIFFTYSKENVAFLESEVLIHLNDREKSSTVRISFEGANRIVPEGREKRAHLSSYFYGNDSSRWKTGVGNYKRIVYDELYDGIDLTYFSTERGLKYEFHVQPFISPNVIKMRYHGVRGLVVDTGGKLIVEAEGGVFKEEKPYSYQIVDDGMIEVESEYIVDGNSVSIKIGKYDVSSELIIDPLIYSTFVGGYKVDELNGITVDAEKNVYLTGSTESPDFPTTPDCFNDSHNEGGDDPNDTFVVKLNPDGSKLLYSTFVGGSGYERGVSIAIDAEQNAYVMGGTKSSDFPTTADCFDNSFNGEFSDAFVFKLNLNGSELLYSTFVGGSQVDEGKVIVLDHAKNAYIGGNTYSPDFPTTEGCWDDSHNNGSDVFISKLNQDGSSLHYSTFIGGSKRELCGDITLDSLKNVYITGETDSPDFPTTVGCFDASYNGGDVFVSKLNHDGSAILYSTFVGGDNIEFGNGITLDLENNAYVSGTTFSSDFPTTADCFDNSFNGEFSDAFVFKLSPDGSSLIYSTFLGGKASDNGGNIILDSENNAYIMGRTHSSDFPVTSDSYDGSYNEGGDIYISILNPAGSGLVYSTFVGGKNSEWGSSIILDSKNNIYIGGVTKSSDFPTTDGCYDGSYNGESDGFVLKHDYLIENKNPNKGNFFDDMNIHYPLFLLLFLSLGLMLVSLALSEPLRYVLLRPLAPHYTRLTEEKIEQDIAQQNIRGQIYRHIADNPGTCLTTIKKNTQAGYGTTVYHLSVLKREGYVRSAARGRKKLFWMKQEFPGAGEASLTGTQRAILKVLGKHGELSRTELLERAGIPKTTLHTTIRELERLGRLREEKRENQHFCSLR